MPAQGLLRYPDVYGNICYLRRARRDLFQVLIGPPPNGWRTIHSDCLDHVKRDVSINAQRIKPGEQPFQTEPQSPSAFGAVDNFNLGRVPMAVDSGSQTHDHRTDAADP